MAHHFKGRLLDGSSGRIGVRIDDVPLKRFHFFDHYFLSLTILGQPGLSAVSCGASADAEIRQSDSVKLGLQIPNWPTLREADRTMQPATRQIPQ